MKFTLSWLKEHLDTTASVEEITYALTDLGLQPKLPGFFGHHEKRVAPR